MSSEVLARKPLKIPLFRLASGRNQVDDRLGISLQQLARHVPFRHVPLSARFLSCGVDRIGKRLFHPRRFNYAVRSVAPRLLTRASRNRALVGLRRLQSSANLRFVRNKVGLRGIIGMHRTADADQSAPPAGDLLAVYDLLQASHDREILDALKGAPVRAILSSRP